MTLNQTQKDTLDGLLISCSGVNQAVHSWVENFISSQKPLKLPSKLEEYDPDPAGKQGMPDQRRLDTAFDAFMAAFETKLRVFMKV
jgi:hypothetical protein